MSAAAVQVKEHPILFSGPMIGAILSGVKTMTRRVMTPQPKLERSTSDGKFYWLFRSENHSQRSAWPEKGEPYWMACPFGDVGDRLWVRESFFDHGPLPGDDNGEYTPKDARIEYRATPWDRDNPEFAGSGWKPSIFMPRWASRLALEITEERAEQVQQISEADAVAEGVDSVSMAEVPRQATMTRRADYKQLWDTINAKRGYSWESNPWVFVIEFKKL